MKNGKALAVRYEWDTVRTCDLLREKNLVANWLGWLQGFENWCIIDCPNMTD